MWFMKKSKNRIKDPKYKKSQKCGFCGRPGHSSTFCWSRPKSAIRKTEKRIKPQSDKTKFLEGKMRAIWYRDNLPDKDGRWECWLQISTFCPKRVNLEQMTLEHVYPKNKYPGLKYEPLNIKPACAFCNKLKGSKTPQQLAKVFVHIAILIQTPEWKAWEKKIIKLSPRVALLLEL